MIYLSKIDEVANRLLGIDQQIPAIVKILL